jgi:hypothetical protein
MPEPMVQCNRALHGSLYLTSDLHESRQFQLSGMADTTLDLEYLGGAGGIIISWKDDRHPVMNRTQKIICFVGFKSASSGFSLSR